jgi:cytochrome c oxidase cbb3-type subunit 3
MSAPNRPQEDQLLDHNYDGIQEYDNPMPRWWVYIFWATILFVPVYYAAPGLMGAGGTKEALYASEMSAYEKAHPPAPAEQTVSNESLLALASDASAISAGQGVFGRNCVACHGAAGGGQIGPNLTDDAWLHGGSPSEIHATVANGVLQKGMPAWGKTLKPDEVNQVVAYVISIHDSHPANAKAPEGVVVEKDGEKEKAPE